MHMAGMVAAPVLEHYPVLGLYCRAVDADILTHAVLGGAVVTPITVAVAVALVAHLLQGIITPVGKVFTVEMAVAAVIITRLKQVLRRVVVAVPLLLLRLMAEMALLAVSLLLVIKGI
jgi:hypothetical protein